MKDYEYIQRELVGYEEIQYALRLDCKKQGCDPVHADDGYLSYLDRRRSDFANQDYDAYIAEHRANDHTINSHATVFVERVVTYGAWEE